MLVIASAREVKLLRTRHEFGRRRLSRFSLFPRSLPPRVHNGDPLPKGHPPPAGRPGAGGAFAAALPGALVPELLWAHYTSALRVRVRALLRCAFSELWTTALSRSSLLGP